MNDANDPLADFREKFHIPDGVIYLDGNSLGPMLKTVPQVMHTAVEREWGDGLIGSWNDAGWWQLPVNLGDMVAPIVGAWPGTIVVTDSTTINIYKALHAALALRPHRNPIIAEASGFPTDLYIAGGVSETNDQRHVRLVGENGQSLDDLLSDDVAVVVMSHVDYRTGALLDMEKITAKIHAAGALVVWDVCHSAGALPVQLEKADADFAVGCTYKYLNGGPGAPAFIYAAKRHHGNIHQPLTGWWGHNEPFAFRQEFDPDKGIRAFLCGTQPILSMRALSASLEMWQEVDMTDIRRKSQALTGLFIDLIFGDENLSGLDLFCPENASERGSQVALTHENAFEIMQCLISRGVIGDVRQPNIMRFGFSPLYLKFEDVRNAAKIVVDTIRAGAWQDEKFSQSGAVT